MKRACSPLMIALLLAGWLAQAGPANAAPLIGATPNPIQFGSVTMGATVTLTLTIDNNAGTAPLNVTWVAITSTLVNSTIKLGTCSAAPFTLAVGASCTYILTFSPKRSADGGSGYIDFTSDTGGVAGTVTRVTFSGLALAAPIISVTPNPMNFGNVTVGSNATGTLTIGNNAGEAPLTVTNLAFASGSGRFGGALGTCAGVSFTLAVGASCTYIVSFSPLAAGLDSASLSITSNTGNVAGTVTNVSISGSGVAPAPLIGVTPNPMNFGNVTTGTATTRTLTINNIAGAAPLTVTNLAFASGSGRFGGALGTCAGVSFTLAVGASCTYIVSFSPLAAGLDSASLSITSNTGNVAGTVTNVPISGTGVAPTPTISVVNGGAGTSGWVITDLFNLGLDRCTQATAPCVQNPGVNGTTTVTCNTASDTATLTSDTSDAVCVGASCTYTPTSLTTTLTATCTAVAATPAAVGGGGGGGGGGGLDNQPPYFPGGGPWLISPEDKANGNGDTPFVWKILTDLDGDTVTYYLYACSGADFTDCKLIDTVVGNGDQNHRHAYGLAASGVALLLVGFGFTHGGRRRLLVAIAALALTGSGALIACGAGGSGGNGVLVTACSAATPDALCREKLNLAPGDYQWKVAADDGRGGQIESEARSFTVK